METHIEVANAVVGMYAKCNAFDIAQEVFYEIPVPGAVSWNGLIAGYMHIIKNGLLEKDSILGIGVVMYASCGMLVESQHMFDKFPVKDVALWSALMVGYAQIGKNETVLCLLERMIEEGIEPDLITFSIVLSTCSHTGPVDDSQAYFELLRESLRN
ncbi:hypothetical protein GOP47_0005668 [Adiantum capillus-veneris]|uniref:Pentatricopeptide repeat-containing protein n=1 Tax=Adiantum capillus-veneris TaxID=13818 RepID=A0A9D4V5K1_ADICA|nr:hypothetical protein GOP47_0005668 [Adiantum capillus-veneris]